MSVCFLACWNAYKTNGIVFNNILTPNTDRSYAMSLPIQQYSIDSIYKQIEWIYTQLTAMQLRWS